MNQTELEQELEQMAAEVPPMPANFRDNWTKAVREDAAAGGGSRHAEPDPGRGMTRTTWIRLLSTAAVFVFLIGGTFVYRATKGTKNSAVQTPVSEIAATSAPEDVPLLTAEEEDWDEAEPEEAEDAYMPADNGIMAMGSAPEGVPMGVNFRAESAKDAGNTEEEGTSGAPAANADETAEEAREEATEEKTAENEAAGKMAGIGEGIRDFLSDMGGFLLASMPYLLSAAVLAAAVAVIVKRRR